MVKAHARQRERERWGKFQRAGSGDTSMNGMTGSSGTTNLPVASSRAMVEAARARCRSGALTHMRIQQAAMIAPLLAGGWWLLLLLSPAYLYKEAAGRKGRREEREGWGVGRGGGVAADGPTRGWREWPPVASSNANGRLLVRGVNGGQRGRAPPRRALIRRSRPTIPP